MRLARAIALLGLGAMTAVLIYAFSVGDLGREGSILLSMPWGVVSLVDLYVGFILFSGWIAFREKSLPRALIWIALMMVGGFFTASLYAFLALQASDGNWQRFWMGRRWQDG